MYSNNNRKLQLRTHPLDGSLLPGITRDSIIKLTKEFYKDIQVCETPTHIDELWSLFQQGDLLEIFVTGTASTVGMVSFIETKYGDIQLSDKSFSTEIKQLIMDIQYGQVKHRFSEVISI